MAAHAARHAALIEAGIASGRTVLLGASMVTSKMIVLVVSIIMPQDIPDIDHVYHVTSFEECWKNAKEFTERDLSDELREHGAVGLKATCAYKEMPSERN